MFKKLILAAGLLAAGTMLITGTRVGAYGRAMVGWAKNKAMAGVPIEADLMAAKQLLSDMDGKIENAVRTVARERVSVRKLEDQYANDEQKLKTSKEAIVALKRNLETNLAAYKPGEADFHRAKLVTLFASYEMLEAKHRAEQKLLQSRREALLSSELKVENLKQAKTELMGRIEALDARRKLMEANKVAEAVEVDDSEIASLKNLVGDIERKLDEEIEVSKELDSLKTGKPTEAPAPSAKDVMEKIDQKFGQPKTTGAGARI